MDIFWRDARSAVRMLRNNRTFGLIGAILCLTGVSSFLSARPSHLERSATAGASDVTYETRDLTFDSSGVSLSGRLFAPRNGGKFPVIVYVTGSGDDDANDAPYPRMLVDAFMPPRIGVFTFNKRGVGKSQGISSGTRFDQRAQDVVAAVHFVVRLPGVDPRHVGMWGISQGGWVIAMAAGHAKDADFAILVSPGGVNPRRQMGFYLENEWRRAGMKEGEIKKASALHEVLFQYYATGQNHDQAQSAVDKAAGEGWLDKYRQANFRTEVPKTNRLPSPEELEGSNKKDPAGLEFYRSAFMSADYHRDYLDLTMPTLVIYGGKDELVPVAESMAVFKKAFAENHNSRAEIKIFAEGDHGIGFPGTYEPVPGYLDFMRDWILRTIQNPKNSS